MDTLNSERVHDGLLLVVSGDGPEQDAVAADEDPIHNRRYLGSRCPRGAPSATRDGGGTARFGARRQRLLSTALRLYVLEVGSNDRAVRGRRALTSFSHEQGGRSVTASA